MTKKWMLAGVVGVALTLVTGCGATLRQAAAQDEAVAMVGGGFQLLGVEGPLAAAHPGQELAAKLGLSTEQRAKLKAIALKYRGQLRPADWQARRAALAAILTAPQVDGAKLAAFIEARGAEFEAKRPARMALAGEMRAVLTPAQREQLATLIETGRPGQAARFDAMRNAARAHATRMLGLTAAQQAAIDALHAKVDGLRADPRHDQFRAAAAGFVRTGDAQPLVAVTTGVTKAIPTAELVALAQSLDQAQRQRIVAHVRQGLARRLARHGVTP